MYYLHKFNFKHCKQLNTFVGVYECFLTLSTDTLYAQIIDFPVAFRRIFGKRSN
jgi:hypothetical protein